MNRGIRDRIEAERRALAPETLKSLNQRLAENVERILGGLTGLKPGRVGLYLATPEEADPACIASWAADQGWVCCYPKITSKKEKSMELVEVGPGGRFVPGAYGISEPAGGEPVDPADLAWIVVPGVAFAEDGRRVGRGAGFYDRYLERAPGALRIGIAFEFQMTDEIRRMEWDQNIHWIITEKRDIRTPECEDWLKRWKERK